MHVTIMHSHAIMVFGSVLTAVIKSLYRVMSGQDKELPSLCGLLLWPHSAAKAQCHIAGACLVEASVEWQISLN